MITIEYDASAAIAALNKMLAKGENLIPVLTSIGEYATNSTQERFATSTSPEGEAWAANSAVTMSALLNKKHVKKDGKINARGVNKIMSKRPLVLNHTLVGDIHYQVNALSVEIGSGLNYAAIHQFGGNAGRGHKVHIPVRPYLGASTEDKAEFLRLTTDYFRL